MSYILDALNKAERQRRLGRVPEVHQPPQVPPRVVRRWPWLLATVLGFNTAALVALWWLGADRPTGLAVLTAASQPDTPVAQADAYVRLAEQPLDVAPPQPYASLPAKLRRALGPLNLDLHVFGDRPERRFVLINSRRYRQGDWLAEGPLLESIDPDGVVLSYRGQRFTLSAQP